MSVSGDLRSAREITAEILQESLEQKKLERGMTELRKKSPIIEQIIEVRKSLEQFEDGGIGIWDDCSRSTSLTRFRWGYDDNGAELQRFQPRV